MIPLKLSGQAVLRWRVGQYLPLLCVLAMPQRHWAAILTVTTTSDSGAGSLRQAILDANQSPGYDTIVFQIADNGIRTINLQAALPPIADPALLDATTQPGYAGKPLVEINGANIDNAPGLRLIAGNTTVRGLALNRFRSGAINISGPGTNVITRTFIGTDPAGVAVQANREGIYILNSWGNTVGGNSGTEVNLISGNSDGIFVQGGGANVIQGNLIGTRWGGAVALPNVNHGIVIYNSAGNQIGGETPETRNVISGNRGSGVYLFGPESQRNVVLGNFIGTDFNGTTALANGGDGVSLLSAQGNLIGGSTSLAGNLISGNTKAGIGFSGGANGNSVEGNLIGTDLAGARAIPNSLSGIVIADSRANTVGGVAGSARNLVSGNKQDGIFLTNSFANILTGNLVGTDITGSSALSNAFNGITLRNSASNTIGGVLSGAGNVLSGNSSVGIHIVGVSSSANIIQGNLIGTDVSGTKRIQNGRDGIGVTSAKNNLIGGSEPGAGNLLSGNVQAGVMLFQSATTGNQILGNRIGTDISGLQPLGNGRDGIFAMFASSNVIGSPVSGAGNIISANLFCGMFLSNSSWNIIQGNKIGVGADGVTPLGQDFHGIECEIGANDNLIGGSGPAGNIIAYSKNANRYAGVRVRDDSYRNAILGNSIFGTTGLGIDLGDFGVTPNDPCDEDIGANMLQNFPVLSRAILSDGLSISGNLPAAPGASYRIQFFSSASNRQGWGEVYLGETRVAVDSSCRAAFAVVLAATPAVGSWVCAVATDPDNNSSEFSAPVVVQPAAILSIVSFDQAHLTLSWSPIPPGFILQETADLAPPVLWQATPQAPVLVNNRLQVTVPIETTNRFYRLLLSQ